MIDYFTNVEFESALPRHKHNGNAMWRPIGLYDGEYCYMVDIVPEYVAIMIRSSIQSDGIRAACGKDSIRAWLVDPVSMKPLGSKLISYTKRTPGWEDRLNKLLRELYKRGRMLKKCPTCKRYMGIFQVKKNGPNKGRLFMKCWEHGHFTWMNADGSVDSRPGKSSKEPIPTLDDSKVAELLSDLPTIKARVERLKELSKSDAGVAVYLLTKTYAFQTDSEKAIEATTDANNVGFSGTDAEFFSSLASQFEKRGSLSDKQMSYVYKRIGKYAVQVEKNVLRPLV